MDTGAVCLAYLHSDEVEHSFHQSTIDMVLYDLGQGDARLVRGGFIAMYTTSSSDVGVSRNETVKVFLDERDAEWLLWIDTDMGFAPDSLDGLLSVADPVERPIVGGLCFSYKEVASDDLNGHVKQPAPTILEWHERDDDAGFAPRYAYLPGVPQQCSATGSAFILIHRSVLERMRDKYGDNWYSPTAHPKNPKKFGEDLSFCVRLAAIGVPLWVHAGVRTNHRKSVFVSEPFMMQHLLAPPASERVDVLVPVLGRPQNAEPFMRSLRASTGLANVFVGCSDPDDHVAWLAQGATVVDTGERTTFAEKVNDLVKLGTAPWVFVCGDDVEFRAGWLDQAVHLAGITGANVVGTNDLANPRVMAGLHATHMLIRRPYIDELGASWDGPGVVCHEGYGHWFVDDEIVTVAKQRDTFAMALASIVVHHHPLYDKKAKMDDTYRLGQDRAGRDRATWERRLKQHTAKREVAA